MLQLSSRTPKTSGTRPLPRQIPPQETSWKSNTTSIIKQSTILQTTFSLPCTLMDLSLSPSESVSETHLRTGTEVAMLVLLFLHQVNKSPMTVPAMLILHVSALPMGIAVLSMVIADLQTPIAVLGVNLLAEHALDHLRPQLAQLNPQLLQSQPAPKKFQMMEAARALPLVTDLALVIAAVNMDTVEVLLIIVVLDVKRVSALVLRG